MHESEDYYEYDGNSLCGDDMPGRELVYRLQWCQATVSKNRIIRVRIEKTEKAVNVSYFVGKVHVFCFDPCYVHVIVNFLFNFTHSLLDHKKNVVYFKS